MAPPPVQIVAPGASPEEAAAVVAALQRFMYDTVAVPPQPDVPAASAWARAALQEGVSRAPEPRPPWA